MCTCKSNKLWIPASDIRNPIEKTELAWILTIISDVYHLLPKDDYMRKHDRQSTLTEQQQECETDGIDMTDVQGKVMIRF